MKLDEKRIKEQRATVWSGMAALIEKATQEKRNLNVDEAKDWDDRKAELATLDAELERVQTYNAQAEAETEDAETRGKSVDEVKGRSEKEMRAFSQFLRRGPDRIDTDLKPYFNTRAVYDAGLNEAGFQATGTAGGFTVPQAFWVNLQIALKAYGGLLNLANVVHTSTGAPMDWPTNDPTNIIGHIVGEGVIDGFADYVFGQGVLQAWTYTSNVILASLELINDSAFDVDSYVRDRVGEAIGRAFAAHLVTGTGTNQPLGIQTALVAYGTPAGQAGGVYQTTHASTTSVQTLAGATLRSAGLNGCGLVSFDDILGMSAKVDPAYRTAGRCSWVMNDTMQTNLYAVTDQFGHPLLQPNVQDGTGNKLYGYPIQIDNNQPNVGTAISTVGGLLFGDFTTAMVVRQVDQADVMRLVERYADARQVGYFGFVRMDARGNDLRAATVYKTNAA